MKYMTKEWYKTMQNTGLHLLLKVSKRAESFSEEYFEELYKKEEARLLKQWKDVSQVKIEDIFPEEFPMEGFTETITDPKELERIKEEYYKQRDEHLSNFERNRYVFNAQQEKKNFEQMLQNNLKRLKESLPSDILNKVADIRVLALNRTSAEVKKDITKFCKESTKAMNTAVDVYWEGAKKVFGPDEPDIVKNLNMLHDSWVISCREDKNDIVLDINSSGAFTNAGKIVFKDCTVIKLDEPINGSSWLYSEIYKKKNGYEIHVLLQKEELIDFIVRVSDVEFI